MKIYKFNKTNDQTIDELVYILNVCKEQDGTFKEPYLANTYNYDLEMPWLYLAREQERYIGFLSVYADSLEEAELALYVLPEYRNRGIAKRLFRKFLESTKEYNIKEISFITERIFLERNPKLVGVWDTEVDAESEFLMTRERSTFDVNLDDRFEVSLADQNCIDQVAKFQAEAFGESLDVATNYVSQSIKDDSTHLYIIKDANNNQVLGSTSVEVSSDCNYLFALAMHKDFRGKGIAKYFIKNVINKLDKFNGKQYQLSVDRSNKIAKNFYDKLGFEIQTEVIYLNIKISDSNMLD